MNELTGGEILFDALNGATLSGWVEQKQQNRLKDSDDVAEGQSSDQPALSRCADGAVSAAQTVHHDAQRPGRDARFESSTDRSTFVKTKLLSFF